MKTTLMIVTGGLMTMAGWIPAAGADDLVSTKLMALELASDIASRAVKFCRDKGYQVSAVVVDRSGIEQVVMRDVYASRFTIQIARDKANAVILSRTKSGDLRRNRADIRPELNHVDGLLVMEGGVPILAGGSLIGAVGVSGAPGGDKDEACAMAAIRSVQDRLDFAD
jgi:uncharacterized protein GlcG (DUF336 family)